jgi:hypothetical protein
MLGIAGVKKIAKKINFPVGKMCVTVQPSSVQGQGMQK